MYLWKLNSNANLLECYFKQDNVRSDVSGESVIIFRTGTSEIRSQVDIHCEVGQLTHEEESVSIRWHSIITTLRGKGYLHLQYVLSL